MIMKSLDPLRAKKIFIRKKLGHTAVSAIKASSVTLLKFLILMLLFQTVVQFWLMYSHCIVNMKKLHHKESHPEMLNGMTIKE